MPLSRLIIARHGNTFDRGDTVTRVGAGTDLPLSVSGQQQADRLAAYFDLQAYRFSFACSSSLLRTKETLKPILERTGRETVPEVRGFLTEVDYGPDENKPEADVEARIGRAAIAAWDKSAIVPDGWIVDPETIRREWVSLIEEVCAPKFQDGDGIVVTSNGIARFVLSALGLEANVDTIKLSTAAFGEFELSPAHPPKLIRWNERVDDR